MSNEQSCAPWDAAQVLEDFEGAWLRSAAASDAFAFLADRAEDIYTATDGEEFRGGY